VGLLTNLLFFPVTGPVAGIKWVLGKVQQVAEEEITDDAPIKQDLMELEMLREVGDISDAEFVEREAQIMARLRDVREWRERLGRPTSGGPVRVARDDANG
jgi:hypothetical protein